MIFPDKLITFHESILAKSICILRVLEEHSMSASDLYILLISNFEDISEFIVALDFLYITNKIILNDNMLQVVKHAS